MTTDNSPQVCLTCGDPITYDAEGEPTHVAPGPHDHDARVADDTDASGFQLVDDGDPEDQP